MCCLCSMGVSVHVLSVFYGCECACAVLMPVVCGR